MNQERLEQKDKAQALETRAEALLAAENALKRERGEWEQESARREQGLQRQLEQLEAQADGQRQAEERLRGQREEAEKLQRTAEEQARVAMEQLDQRRKEAEAEIRERRQQEARDAARLLEARYRQLEESEAAVAQYQAEAEAIHRQFLEDRRKLQEQAEAERQLLAAERRREMADLEEKRQAVRRRSEQLDHSQAALQQLREELSRMHRETFELRLATEELAAELAKSAPGRSQATLAALQTKLAEHAKATAAERAEQKQSLLALRAELAQQHRALADQRGEFQRWSTERREELDRLAVDLEQRKERWNAASLSGPASTSTIRRNGWTNSASGSEVLPWKPAPRFPKCAVKIAPRWDRLAQKARETARQGISARFWPSSAAAPWKGRASIRWPLPVRRRTRRPTHRRFPRASPADQPPTGIVRA